MEPFQELVTGVRRLRSEHRLAPRHPLNVVISDPDSVAEDWWEQQLISLAAVAPTFGDPPAGGGWTRIIAGNVQGFVPLAGLIDSRAERMRLGREATDARAALEVAERKLGNPDFVAKAPRDIVAREERKADELRTVLEGLTRQLAQLGA